jgi:hypothetical protein
LELIRYSSNAWGQEVVEGVSWDLLPVFFLLGVAFIVIHSLSMWLLARKRR